MFISLLTLRKKLSKLYVAQLKAKSAAEQVLIRSFITDLKEIAAAKRIHGNTKKIRNNHNYNNYPAPSLEDIRIAVCNYHKIDPRLIRRRTRNGKIVRVRQQAVFFAANYTKASLKEIAHVVANWVQHSTVLYTCKTVYDLYDTNKTYKKEIDELTEIIEALC